MFSGKTLLIFGGGDLQLSLIETCKKNNIRSVVIDPNPNAIGKDFCDVFIVVGGQDFEGTCKVVDSYEIDGIITAATDKPLIMMARIAEQYNFPFYSLETAINSTDKYRMKEVFVQNGIPCATGYKVKTKDDIDSFPAILKPVDNSGSRGVFFCSSAEEASDLINRTFKQTKQDFILAEEYISGLEFSIESIHYRGTTNILQITSKTTSEFPSNVELSHHAPAAISQGAYEQIKVLIQHIAKAFRFENCASHIELKIEKNEITIIEASPRLGGDKITSHLVPLSTGINMENILIQIALNEDISIPSSEKQCVGIYYFNLEAGSRIQTLPKFNEWTSLDNIVEIDFKLKEGDIVPPINSSLDRYGYLLLKANSKEELESIKDKVFNSIKVEHS